MWKQDKPRYTGTLRDRNRQLFLHELSVKKWERRLIYRALRQAYFEGADPVPDPTVELERRSREIHAIEVGLSRL